MAGRDVTDAVSPPNDDGLPPAGDDGSADVEAGLDASDSDVLPTEGGVPVDGMPPGDAAPTVVERTYQVLHWNIAGGADNNCQPDLITRAVRRYVHDNHADFVGLNEVCPAQFPAIEAALRAEWGLAAGVQFSAYMGDGLPNIVGDAIYSRFGLQDVLRLMVGQDSYGSRNLVCGQVPDLPHMRFCTVHLTPGDATARTQLPRVLDRIEQYWTDESDTVILDGDLNLEADDVALDAVYSASVDTPNNRGNHGHYREVDDADPAHCLGYGEGTEAGTVGGPCHAGGKIDFILARENRIVSGMYSGSVFPIPTDCTGACSDHHALLGSLRVRIDMD